MDLPATSDTWVWQENARLPSMCTRHAPHSPAPQPNLVPVSLSSSLMIHKRGVVGGAADEAGFPFIVKSVDMFASPAELLQTIALDGPKKSISGAQISPRNPPNPSAVMLMEHTCAVAIDPHALPLSLLTLYSTSCRDT